MKEFMSENDSILGCFVSGPAVYHDSDQKTVDFAKEKGKLFRDYIWGKSGICDRLKLLKHDSYSKDLILILFQFYLNPIPYQLEHLKEIERYRKKEKSIGIPIIVNDDNFFDRTEKERKKFLIDTMMQKLNLLANVIKRNKLDTKLDLLKVDLQKILSESE